MNPIAVIFGCLGYLSLVIAFAVLVALAVIVAMVTHPFWGVLLLAAVLFCMWLDQRLP